MKKLILILMVLFTTVVSAQKQFKIYATHVEDGQDVGTVDFSEPCAIIMGSEDEGVSQELLDKCDRNIRIPMVANFDSLNVSVSTGIVLYEAMKQRNQFSNVFKVQACGGLVKNVQAFGLESP